MKNMKSIFYISCMMLLQTNKIHSFTFSKYVTNKKNHNIQRNHKQIQSIFFALSPPSPPSPQSPSPTTTATTTTTTITTTTLLLKSNDVSDIDEIKGDDKMTLVTAEEITKFALQSGVVISLSTLGPGYRAVARSSHNTTQIIGYCNGFIRPTGKILHLDKMEVFKKALTRARDENPEFKDGGSVFGVGLLLGCLCLTHGLENNCEIAEFLAIDDNDFQHKRLVRHYKRLGLNVIRYVGEDITNIPDRLVWGGVGTLMNANIIGLLEKWTPLFQDGLNKKQQQ